MYFFIVVFFIFNVQVNLALMLRKQGVSVILNSITLSGSNKKELLRLHC